MRGFQQVGNRVRTDGQQVTNAAKEIADRKTFEHQSYRVRATEEGQVGYAFQRAGEQIEH